MLSNQDARLLAFKAKRLVDELDLGKGRVITAQRISNVLHDIETTFDKVLEARGGQGGQRGSK